MTDSSPEQITAEAAVEVPVSDAKPASSTEQPQASLLDSVTAALAKKTESPTVITGKDEALPPAAREARRAERLKRANEVIDPDAETGDYPRTAEGRIKYLSDQVREFKKSAAETESIRADAQLAQKILGYLDTNGIEPEELDNTLALTALIKRGEIEKAIKVIEPIYRSLLDRNGDILPADLQEKVRLGHMTKATAVELHKARTTAKNAAERERQTTAKTVAEKQQTEHNTRVRTAASATSTWEQAKAAADPDWHLKQDAVAAEVELELRRLGPEGYPRTAKEAVDLSEKALKTVEERLKKFAPKPQTRQMPTGLTSPRAKTQPKSLMEAIDAALAR